MLLHQRVASLFLVTLLSAATVLAQQSTPRTAPAAKLYLDVVVAPKSGAPVADLQQQDFTVLDNNAPQTITSFKAVTGREAPVEIVLVLDAVNTTYRTVSIARTDIGKFLRAEGGRLAYPIAVVISTDKGIQGVSDFSSDGNALSAALDQADVALRSNTRSTGVYGAAKEAPRPGRKIILWVSPGWPLLSGPAVEIDAKQQNQIFANLVSITNQLLQARVTLYSVDPLGNGESLSRGAYYKQFLKGISKPGQVQIGNLGLPVLAVQSGGLALNFNNDVASLLQECLSDAAPYYEISFEPTPSDQRDEYHRLEIQIAKPGLTARTRQGYYAQPATHN
jgi:VWFA-related protein